MGYILTDICRYCERRITAIFAPSGWIDNLGSTICIETENRKHYPVNPVEGFDY